MKNKYKICFSLLFAAILLISTFATPIVSPALNVLAKNNTMIKSGLMYSDVYFSEQDFMKCLGIAEIDSITVKSLPDASEGVLKLGTLNVTEGQVISREYISSLRFIPFSDEVVSCEFVFNYNNTDIPCVLRMIEEVNYAPAFAENEDNVRTYCNVSCYGNARAKDPDGDATNIQIISYPAHGTLTITDVERGNYKYTPSSGFVGEDKFVIVARDDFGNYSSVQTVKVEVEKNNIFFADTAGHWCENAAICLYELGAADVVNYQDVMEFCPDESVTREEFVTMAMKALGVETLTDSNTSFVDNSKIDVKYRPYIATAERMGYINGKDVEGTMYFDPKGNITKSEAAVVVNNILSFEEEGYVTTFADDSAIPTWAKTAVYALTSAGVFNGNGEGIIAPSAILSRAETVQMLYNIIEK